MSEIGNIKNICAHVILTIGFFFGRICRRQIFSLMLAKSVLFFVMVAAKWSQIFVLSQKIGRGMLNFIFLVAKKVKLRDHNEKNG